MAQPTLVDPSRTVGHADPSDTHDVLSCAPYALVRTTALARPHDGPAATRHRQRCEQLVATLQRAAELSGPLSQALYDCAATEDPVFHRRVVLPLRRDVHNHRSPSPAARAALGDLPRRVELLGRWLAARDEAAVLLEHLVDERAEAIDDDRRALAALCHDEHLRRAVTLSGSDLLRAIDRAATHGADPDSRARKSEPTVLRYAMRAATRTAPLTWFSHVGWGRWAADLIDGSAAGRGPTGHAEPDRRLVAELLHGLLTEPAARRDQPHHLPADLRVHDGHAVFRRARAGHDYTGGATDELRLPITAPTQFLLDRLATAGSVAPARLAIEIASRLPAGGPDAHDAADRFVQQLVDNGMLLPDLPVSPHDPAPAASLVRVLGRAGKDRAAQLMREIDSATRGFPDLPASRRVTAAAALADRWTAALAEVGVPAQISRPPVTEDVTVDGVQVLGADAGAACRPTLAQLTPLFEAVDLCAVFAATVHDHFLARHGRGGRCSVATLAQDLGELWRQAALVGPDGVIRDDPALGGRPTGSRVAAAAQLRRRLATAASDVTAHDGEMVLPDHVLATAAAARDSWTAARPASYSVFAMPLPAHGGAVADGSSGLCVNRVYGGWGRFTSRFLRQLPGVAADDVAAQLRRALPRDHRAAQIRPVSGFNANLHPLLVDDEIAGEPGLGTLHPRDLDVVHDLATDRVRVRHTATGRLLDVLYLGFLVPVALPAHLGPLLNDLGSGVVDVAATIAPGAWIDTPAGRVHQRPRLRWRDVVLSRRRWRLPAAIADNLSAELLHHRDRPAAVACRWRAALGLPADVFVSGAPSDPAAGGAEPELDSLLDYLGRPRSQYVDLGSALHLHCLARTLSTHTGDLVIEEALPVPAPGRPVTELVIETYRSAS